MDRLQKNQMNFINLRLGTFIHFNSATVQFQEGSVKDWEWEYENTESPRRFPFAEKDWNPEELDCAQWAEIAKSAGCRFAALTAKHHEGFALWPTNYSEHSVKNASCKADIVAEFLKAFRREGIQAGLYFSILDLTSGIGQKSCTKEQKDMIKNQIRELLTNYGEIPFLIADGWNSPWGGPTYEMLPFEELDELVKSLQPDCLFMNIGCTDNIYGTDILLFENSAGQEVEGSFAGPGLSCNKFTDTWFWRKTDPQAELVKAKWAVEKMEKYFPMNINFMLNLSPNPKGRIDENQRAVFVETGKQKVFPESLKELPVEWLKRV